MSKYLTSRKKVANKKAANSFYLVESYKSLDVDTLLHMDYVRDGEIQGQGSVLWSSISPSLT